MKQNDPIMVERQNMDLKVLLDSNSRFCMIKYKHHLIVLLKKSLIYVKNFCTSELREHFLFVLYVKKMDCGRNTESPWGENYPRLYIELTALNPSTSGIPLTPRMNICSMYNIKWISEVQTVSISGSLLCWEVYAQDDRYKIPLEGHRRWARCWITIGCIIIWILFLI